MTLTEGLSIVIPVHNEELGIHSLTDDLVSNFEQAISNLEIIFVDDGSTDNTWEQLKKISMTSQIVKCIRLCRNVGQMRAINYGVLRANQSWVAVIDGDGQNPSSALLRMWELREKDSVIFGVKSTCAHRNMRRLITDLFYKLMRCLLKSQTLFQTGEFKLLSKSLVHEITAGSNPNSVMRFRIAKLQLKQIPLFYVLPSRAFGNSKYSLTRRLNFVLASIFTVLERSKIIGVFGLFGALFAEWLILCFMITKDISPYSYFAEIFLFFFVTLFLILFIYWNFFLLLVFSRDKLSVCEEINGEND